MAGQFDEWLQGSSEGIASGQLLKPELTPFERFTRGPTAQGAIRQTIDLAPDRAAEAQRLSGSTGLPWNSIYENPAPVQQFVREGEVNRLLETAPVTRGFMAIRENASIAHDDVESLVAVENLWRPKETGFTAMRPFAAPTPDERRESEFAAQQVVAVFQAAAEGGIRVLGEGARGVGEAIETGRDFMVSKPSTYILRNIGLGGVAAEIDNIYAGVPWWLNPTQILIRGGTEISHIGEIVAPADEARTVSSDISGGIGQVAAQFAAAAIAGGPRAITAALTFGMGFMQGLFKAEESGSEDTPGGQAAMLLSGLETAGLEMTQFNRLFRVIPENIRSKVGRFLAGFTTEAAQEIFESVAHQVTAYVLHDPSLDIFEEGLAYEGGVGGMVGGIVSLIIPGRQGFVMRDQMDRTREALQASKLWERARPQLMGHLSSVMRANGTSEILISPEAIEEALGPEDAAAFFETAGLRDQALAARRNGTELVLSPEKFAQHIFSDDSVYPKLKDQVRFGAEAFTAAEAKELEGSGLRERLGQLIVADSTPFKPDTPETVDDPYLRVAEEELGLKAFFQSADEAGMTPKQYESYLRAVDESVEASRNRMQDARLRREQQELSAEWRTEEASVREAVASSLEQTPLYSATKALTEVTEARDRLDRKALLRFFNNDAASLDLLPRGPKGRRIYTAEGGIDPEIVAERYGFEAADIMLFQFADNPSFDEAVATETQKVMLQRHGDLDNRLQTLQRAREALHTDKRADVLTMELNKLETEQGLGNTSKRLLRQIARLEIQKTEVGRIGSKTAVTQFMSQAGRLGHKAGLALRKGDRALATRLKFQQVLNFQMAQEVLTVRDQFAKQQKYFRRFSGRSSRMPGVKVEYFDMAKTTLAAAGIGARQQPPDPNFLANAVKNDGAVFIGGSSIQLLAGSTQSWRNMTLARWNELHATIKMIEQQGRNVLQVKRGEKKIAIEEAVEELNAQLERLPTLNRAKNLESIQNPGGWDKVRSGMAWAGTLNLKIEQLMIELDGGKPNGPFHSMFFRLFADAQTAHHDLYANEFQPLVEELKATVGPDGANRLGAKVRVSELGRTMTYGDILWLALYSGSESGINKVIEGSKVDSTVKVPWTQEGIEAAVARLSPSEFAWLNKGWAMWARLFPQVQAIARDEMNSNPLPIESRPFVSPHGQQMTGGYVPIFFDSNRSRAPIAEQTKPGSALEAMQGDRTQTTVYHGLVHTRTGYHAPIMLDIGMLSRSMDQLAHFLTHYAAVRDTLAILNNTSFRNTAEKKIGKEYFSEVQQWVGNLASAGASKDIQHPAIKWISDFFRSNITVAVLGYSYTTSASQGLGLVNSVKTLGETPGFGFSNGQGAKWLGVGFDVYLENPALAVQNMMALSGEMRHRIRAVNREVADSVKFLKGQTNWWAQYNRAAMYTIGGIQFYAVDVPTWYGGFNRGLSEGMSVADAVAYADSAVRRSQGTGHLKDLTRLQRSQGLGRWFTMFMTYTSTYYNQQRHIIKGMPKLKNLPGVVSQIMWITVAAAMLDALIRFEFPDDDDVPGWVASRVGGQLFLGVPIVGQAIASAAQQGIRPDILPANSLGRHAFTVSKDLLTGEVDEDTFRNAFGLAGTAVGLGGTIQMIRVWKALQEFDRTPVDFLVGPKRD